MKLIAKKFGKKFYVCVSDENLEGIKYSYKVEKNFFPEHPFQEENLSK